MGDPAAQSRCGPCRRGVQEPATGLSGAMEQFTGQWRGCMHTSDDSDNLYAWRTLLSMIAFILLIVDGEVAAKPTEGPRKVRKTPKRILHPVRLRRTPPPGLRPYSPTRSVGEMSCAYPPGQKPTICFTSATVRSATAAARSAPAARTRSISAGSAIRRRMSAEIGARRATSSVGQRRLEDAEPLAGEPAQDLSRRLAGHGAARCRPGSRPPGGPSASTGSSGRGAGSVLARLIFLAMASASSVRLMRD